MIIIGDTPETIKITAKKPGLEFLVDHWPYNDGELTKVFDLVFDWKAKDKEGRDVVFVGGGIYFIIFSNFYFHIIIFDR